MSDRANQVEILTDRRSFARRVFAGTPLSARLGLFVIATYVLVALFAPAIAPYGEAAVVGDHFEPWGQRFLLGTDQLGRDMLSRLIFGARNTIGIAVATTGLEFLIGVMLGLQAALLGGWTDRILSWLIDMLMAIPQLIFALVFLLILGSSTANLILIIALLDSTRVFRLTRAAAMNVVATDFIEAARLQGESVGWIAIREILPNVLPTLIIEFGLRFSFVFLTISALSFLGLGIQPPAADWGSMVRENATLITFGDVTPLLPAAAIAGLTVAVNFVADWLLDRYSGSRSGSLHE